MKVTNIKQEGLIYHVTLTPNGWERFWGRKEKTIRVKDGMRVYYFGGGNVYYKEDGSELGNLSDIGEAIDNWKRRF